MLEKTFGVKKGSKKQAKTVLGITKPCRLSDLPDSKTKMEAGKSYEERYLHLNALINKINTKNVSTIKQQDSNVALYIDKISPSQTKTTCKSVKKSAFQTLKNTK